MLKLWIVAGNHQLYELKEGVPLVINCDHYPFTIQARNGFHYSKPFTINNSSGKPVLIGVGCEADNGRLWGAVLLSGILAALFFAVNSRMLLAIANLPIFYIFYLFFLRPKQFITISTVETE